MLDRSGEKKTVIHCKRASDVPRVKHWAILETQSGTEKGYDPGDPDTSFNFMRYTAYLDGDEWKKAVIKRTEDNHKAYGKVGFVAIEVQPAVISTTVAVSIEPLP